MDSITFEVDGCTIRLEAGEVRIWAGSPDGDPDIVLPIMRMIHALETYHLLRRA